MASFNFPRLNPFSRLLVLIVALSIGIISLYTLFIPRIETSPYRTVQQQQSYAADVVSSNESLILPFRGSKLDMQSYSHQLATRQKANATFVILARNSDVWEVVKSIESIEDRFNWWAGYSYTFLNEQPFDNQFKTAIEGIISTTAEFGVIPKEHWEQPDWVDEDKATEGRNKMKENNIIYGDSVPYRNMCRFNSGFFYRHPLMLKYRYYWRIEPSVQFYCDIKYDPFLVMQEQNKVYGWTLSLYEYKATIETLWDATKEFIELHPEHVAKDNSMGFLSDDGGKEYNLCHFWSNFEIADLDFWRGEAYSSYFDYLDKKGGFYYERWGDAPVHSIGAALFAPKDQVHFFSDIGYYHGPYWHCPTGDAHGALRCSCKVEDNFDDHWYSCTNKYKALYPHHKWFGSP